MPSYPGYAVVLESRKLPDVTGNYVFLQPDKKKPAPPKARTLLICLHGAGNRAEDFATNWVDLVNSRTDVVVAALNYGNEATTVLRQITAIIHETVAHDRVDPQHVILVGYSMGGYVGSGIVGKYPELFAGYVNIAMLGASQFFFSPAMKSSLERMGLYFVAGDQEEGGRMFNYDLAEMRNFGFAHVGGEQPSCGHNIPGPVFVQISMNMMKFFDPILAENDRQRKAGAAPAKAPEVAPRDNVVAERRQVSDSSLVYAFLYPDPAKATASPDKTLLICLPARGQSAEDFAKNWRGLVNHRADVVVAVADNLNEVTGQTSARAIANLIADTVARDHVNPKHVFLVGYSQGGMSASLLAGDHPELFAGFAGIATAFFEEKPVEYVSGKTRFDIAGFDKHFFSPTLSSYASRLPVYYAVGNKDDMFKDEYAGNRAQLKAFGFTTLQTENPNIGHTITQDEIANMMGFFDQVLAGKFPVLTASINNPPTAVTAATRTLANAKENYLLLESERAKLPAMRDSTLVIYLPDPNEKTTDIAKRWAGLLDSRADVLVAVPDLTPAPKDINAFGHGLNAEDKVMAIIEDVVARNQANPRHVILVSYGESGKIGGTILGDHPELFAGYAALATDFPPAFFSPALQSSPGSKRTAMVKGENGWTEIAQPLELYMPIFYAVGRKDQIYDAETVNKTLAQLKDFGIFRLATSRPDCGHDIPGDNFTTLTKDMMSYFDNVIPVTERLTAKDELLHPSHPGQQTINSITKTK